MRRDPEKLIARLRNRRGRIIGMSILCLVALVCSVAFCGMVVQGMHYLVPQEGDDLALRSMLLPQMILPIAFASQITLLFAFGFGIAIAFLIIEIFSFTKNELLVNLWDRINELEKKLEMAKDSDVPQE